MDQIAERAEGQLIVHVVSHQSAALGFLKGVRMMPKLIGTFALDVGELVGRIPDGDLGTPPHGDAVQAQRVVDQGARVHRDRLRREDVKAQQRRGDALQVGGGGEEIEDHLAVARNPNLALESVHAHCFR